MSKCFAFMIVCSLSGLAIGSRDDKQQPKTIDISGTWKMVGLIETGEKIPADRVGADAHWILMLKRSK
jgi:hypothetical protein